jgi:hypothetical protein
VHALVGADAGRLREQTLMIIFRHGTNLAPPAPPALTPNALLAAVPQMQTRSKRPAWPSRRRPVPP